MSRIGQAWMYAGVLPDLSKHDDAMAQVAFDEVARTTDSLKESGIRQLVYQLRIK